MGGIHDPSPPYITLAPQYRESDQDEVLNERQKIAVARIMTAHHAPLPYLIFGPPGTGKTKTLTEAAFQIHSLDKSSRILLVAPSNSATDHLAIKMLERGVMPSTLLRINAFSRPLDLPPAIRGVSNVSKDRSGDEVHAMPELKVIWSKRIIVVTCLMAAKLHALGCTEFFTHGLIDEAGHAEEPLTISAIAGLVSRSAPECRLVMAGDPKQLGPVILSKLAQTNGLATSTFERLIEHAEPYARSRDAEGKAIGPLDDRYICKLVINYRSHPTILEVPNAAFNDNELIAGALGDTRKALLDFPGIKADPRKKGKDSLPIIFHAVVGKDMREERSPSWYNIDELALVNQYVTALTDAKYRGQRPAPKDIGIISPYRKQVEKIRTVLKTDGRPDLKVGSVEEFQGQERLAIIVSTVRSSPEHLGHDEKFRLGFLRNPKRFNVAVTRAKAMLIVIGNPHVPCCRDPHWLSFTRFVYKRKGWVGSEAPESVKRAEGDDDEMEGNEERSLLDAVASLGFGDDSDEAGTSNLSGHRDESPLQEEGGEMLLRDD